MQPAIAAACAAVEESGAQLLDWSSDAVHHRSVLTIVGNADQVLEAAIALAGFAVERIDLRDHRGVHPRIGALDVLPFIPLQEATLEDAAALAHQSRRSDMGAISRSIVLLRRSRAAFGAPAACGNSAKRRLAARRR